MNHYLILCTLFLSVHGNSYLYYSIIFSFFRLISLKFPSLSCRSCIGWASCHGPVLDSPSLAGFCFMSFSKVLPQTENSQSLNSAEFLSTSCKLFSCLSLLKCFFSNSMILLTHDQLVIHYKSQVTPVEACHEHSCSLCSCAVEISWLNILSCIYCSISSICLHILSPILPT